MAAANYYPRILLGWIWIRSISTRIRSFGCWYPVPETQHEMGEPVVDDLDDHEEDDEDDKLMDDQQILFHNQDDEVNLQKLVNSKIKVADKVGL